MHSTCAPCLAASAMYFACFSIIESLSPVQATWTRAAFTMVIADPPYQEKDGAKRRSAPPRNLRAGGGSSHLAHGLAGLLGEVPPAEKRHEHVIGDEGRAEAPEP